MAKYSKWIGYEYGYWSFRGLKGYDTPSWIFLYDDLHSFGGSVVRVQVSVFGGILQMQPNYEKLCEIFFGETLRPSMAPALENGFFHTTQELKPDAVDGTEGEKTTE